MVTVAMHTRHAFNSTKLLKVTVVSFMVICMTSGIWVVFRRRYRVLTLGGRPVSGPYRVHTSMLSVGDDPRKTTKLWQKVKRGPDGRMIETVEGGRDVSWVEVCKEDQIGWTIANKVLIDSKGPEDYCDDPALLRPKGRCSTIKHSKYRSKTLIPSLNQCPAALVELASNFFAPIKGQLSRKDAANAVYISDDPSDELFIYRIQYDAHLLYTDTEISGPNSGTLEYERLNHTLSRMVGIQHKYGIESFDMAISPSTIPPSMRREQALKQVAARGWEALKLPSMTRCADTNLLPILEWSNTNYGPFNEWDAKMNLFKQAAEKVPWEKRQDLAVFSGPLLQETCSENGHLYINKKECLQLGRGRLVQLATAYPELLSLKFTGQPWGWDCVQVTPAVSSVELATTFRYIVLAETQCGWTPELRRFLFSGSTILLQSSPCKEYFQFLLEPWVHYIPWEYETLVDRLLWTRQNPKKAQAIAQNALQFAQKYLNQDAMLCWDTLMLGKAAMSARQQFIDVSALAERVITGLEPKIDKENIIKY